PWTATSCQADSGRWKLRCGSVIPSGMIELLSRRPCLYCTVRLCRSHHGRGLQHPSILASPDSASLSACVLGSMLLLSFGRAAVLDSSLAVLASDERRGSGVCCTQLHGTPLQLPCPSRPPSGHEAPLPCCLSESERCVCPSGCADPAIAG